MRININMFTFILDLHKMIIQSSFKSKGNAPVGRDILGVASNEAVIAWFADTV